MHNIKSLREYLVELRARIERLLKLLATEEVRSLEEGDEEDMYYRGYDAHEHEENYPHNHEKFDNIYAPEKIEVGDSTYTIYRARFSSLGSLYDYLKANPPVNKRVFYRLHSLTGSSDFAGKPYEEAVEDLIGEVDPGYEEFLKLQNDINKAGARSIHKYRTVKTIAGGHLSIPDYVAGAPLCFTTEERIVKPKFVRIHVMLSYYWGTTKEQVLNRAIIITNIIKALEKAGYSVDLNTFELSTEGDEIMYVVVDVKKHGSNLQMSALYKTLCHVEFLRRILFRVLETLDVKNDWEDGYGSTASESFTRKVLRLGNNDIFFDQPRSMGIGGEDLAEDFERAIKHLNLEDKIDVEKAKEEFKNDVKVLRKTRN